MKLPYNGPKHQNIKPEDIELNKQYAFTYNPKEQMGMTIVKYVFFKRFINCYHDYINNIHKQFNKLQGCKIKVVTEVSQLGRIHFHGYIKITNPFLYYVKDVPFLMHSGTIAIKPIEDPKIWIEYLKKQNKIFKSVHTPYADSKHTYESQE